MKVFKYYLTSIQNYQFGQLILIMYMINIGDSYLGNFTSPLSVNINHNMLIFRRHYGKLWLDAGA